MRNILLASMLVVPVASPLRAQVAPDAGQALREVRPPPAQRVPDRSLDLQLPQDGAVSGSGTGTGTAVEVRDFAISGNESLPTAELLAQLADLKGQTLGFGDMESAAGRITRYYHNKGYLLARAYVPAQTIREGVLQLAVLEGYYGKVTVENHSRLRDSALAPLESLKSGEAVRAGTLDRALLLENKLVGARTRSVLEPGNEVGTSNLAVVLDPTPLLAYKLEYDNFGNYYTGENRLTGTLQVNSPLRLGDQLELQVVNTFGGLSYYTGRYDIPVSRWGTRVGAAYEYVHYELRKRFESLDAHGIARTASVFLRQPLIVSRRFELDTKLQYDRRLLDDQIQSVGYDSPKDSWLGTFSLEGFAQDGLFGGGATSVYLNVGRGKLKLRNPTDLANDALTARSAGYFTVFRPTMIRTQRLTDRFSLMLLLNGQWARRNLSGVDKFSLGGFYGVRAYPENEGSGDDGVLGELSLRYLLAQSWQLSVFADRGHSRQNHEPWDDNGGNTSNLSAAGVSGQYVHGAWKVQATSAWRLSSAAPVSGPERKPRLWLHVEWAP